VQKSLKVGSRIVDPSLNSMSCEGRTVRLEPYNTFLAKFPALDA